MKRMAVGAAVAAVLVGSLAGAAVAQDRPGLAVGGFYETRTDNEVEGETLDFNYYGVRLALRDERWFEIFVDLGVQTAEWGDYESDDGASVGLGGTLWLARAEDLMIPLDLGVYGSIHRGACDLEADSGPAMDGDYTRVVGQAVVRAQGYGIAKPFMRAGIMRSNLDISGYGGDDDDWVTTNPAINVGVELEAGEQLVLTLEGNYSESAGFAVHADFWF